MQIVGKLMRYALTAVLFLGVGCGTAGADTAVYFTTLSGAAEAPPTPSPGTGTASLVVDTDTLLGTYYLSFSGLSSPQTAAHFHNALPGYTGGVMFPLPLGSPVSGTWAMTAIQYAKLAAGEVYVNVHTSIYPGGEIRGQMALDSVVGVEASTFGAVKTLFR